MIFRPPASALNERVFLPLSTADSRFAGVTTSTGWAELWVQNEVGFHLAGKPSEVHALHAGENLVAGIRRLKLQNKYAKQPEEFEVLNLPPGNYFPRIARPSRPYNDIMGLAHRGNFDHERAGINLQLTMLTDRLRTCFQVVEPSVANLSAYGAEFRNIIILAATEVEAQCKGILSANNYGSPSRMTTRDYVKVEPALRLADYEIAFPEYPWLASVAPFRGWHASKPTESLTWYAAYNAIKHDREGSFPQATLEHALNAVAAVVVIAVGQFGRQFLAKSARWNQLFAVRKEPRWSVGDCYWPTEAMPEPVDYPFP